MLLSQTINIETRLQVLITLHQRIKYYWNLEDEEKKNLFKQFIA